MDHIEECGMAEGPMGAMPSLPAPEQHEGNPVTVNVNMNASGKEHVADLLDMMKNAGLGGAEPVSAKMLSPRMDMERLSAMMGEPEDEPEMEEVDDEIEVEGDYANEPDAQYGDMSDAIPDGNDLNRKKKAYTATQDGDNPMAVEDDSNDLETRIKEELQAALEAKYGKKKSKCSECGNEVAEEDEEYVAEKQRLDPKCWKGKKIGNPKTKMKGGVRVNNCVPA